MKFILFLIIVLVSGAAGYLTEPNFRMQLTGIAADFKKPETDSKPKSKAKPESTAEDEVPFEKNPDTTTPIPEVDPNPDPVVPDAPETSPGDPAETPTTPTTPTTPEVTTPTQPETPVQAADVVLVMKASVASGQISKFSASQVLDWQAGSGMETIDGETYQTGSVTYQAETPFGTKNLPAKALIKNGKVVRWISPKSGMKID